MPEPEVEMDLFLQAHAGGAHVVDVREPHEYHAGHVPGASLIPLGVVPLKVHELPRDRPVYVICASGHRSLTATRHMIRAGIDARSVRGGTIAWARSGGPLERGPA